MNKALFAASILAILTMWPDPRTSATQQKNYSRQVDSTIINYEKIKGEILDFQFYKKYDTSIRLLNKLKKKDFSESIVKSKCFILKYLRRFDIIP